jgi:nitrate/nitrite transporter NarK
MIETQVGIFVFSSVWGLACGILSVSMNAIWSHTFGRRHLGKIQGAVAVCHVLSSAGGPKIMVLSLDATGAYGAFFYVSAVFAALTTVAVCLVSFPRLAPTDEPSESASFEESLAVAAATE